MTNKHTCLGNYDRTNITISDIQSDCLFYKKVGCLCTNVYKVCREIKSVGREGRKQRERGEPGRVERKRSGAKT